MSRILIKNVATNVEYTLELDGESQRLPPGAYRVMNILNTNPRDTVLQGVFQVLETSPRNPTLTTVEQVPLKNYTPFRIEDPNFLVVGLEAPFGNWAPVSLISST